MRVAEPLPLNVTVDADTPFEDEQLVGGAVDPPWDSPDTSKSVFNIHATACARVSFFFQFTPSDRAQGVTSGLAAGRRAHLLLTRRDSRRDDYPEQPRWRSRSSRSGIIMVYIIYTWYLVAEAHVFGISLFTVSRA